MRQPGLLFTSAGTEDRLNLPILFATLVDHPEQACFTALRSDILRPDALAEAQGILFHCGAVRPTQEDDDSHQKDPSRSHEMLLEIAHGDDANALSILYVEKFDLLVTHIKIQIPDLPGEDASGIVQKAFVRIAEHACQYRGTKDASAWAWMKKIALNLAIDYARHSAKSSIDMVEDLAYSGEDSESLDPRRQADLRLIQNYIRQEWVDPPSVEKQVESRQCFNLFMNSLKPQEREVFFMLSQGIDQVSIANRLGLSKGRISQIIENMRNQARKYELLP